MLNRCMSPRDLVYVGHMLDADENLRLALTHLVQVIGEAGRHVSREFCPAHPEIEWADMSAASVEAAASGL